MGTRPPKPRLEPYPPLRVDSSEIEPHRDCGWLPKPKVVVSDPSLLSNDTALVEPSDTIPC